MDQSTFKELGALMPTAPLGIEEQARAVAELGAELRAGRRRVFFYAASGFDWQPLHRFSHLCDCFVYVDPRCDVDGFMQARQQLVGQQTRAADGLMAVDQLLHVRSAYDVLTDATGQLAVMRNEAWTMIPNLQDRQPWGAVLRLKRQVGGTCRDLWLMFVAGSPVIAYERLLVGTGTAPTCLAMYAPRFNAVPAEAVMQAALDPPHGIPQIEHDWNAMMGWDGELGQLVRARGTLLPKLVAADEPMGWQTYGFWYRVTRWRCRYVTPVLSLRNEPWPNLGPVPAGRRRVVVTRRPVNPLTARRAGGIVMGHDTFQQYRWPDNLLVILVGPPIFPDQMVPDRPGVLNLDIGGVPLLRALGEIERVCAERGINRVAVQEPLGFEDEAEALALWRQQDGQIRELTLHVDCDGRLLDYGQVADEVE